MELQAAASCCEWVSSSRGCLGISLRLSSTAQKDDAALKAFICWFSPFHAIRYRIVCENSFIDLTSLCYCPDFEEVLWFLSHAAGAMGKVLVNKLTGSILIRFCCRIH